MRRFGLTLVVATGCGQLHQADQDDPIDALIDAPIGGDAGVDSDAFDAPPSMADAAFDGPPASMCPVGTWCAETAPIASTADLRGVHARDSADVFVVGTGGAIIRRRNDAWTAMTSGTTTNLIGVWAANANDAWAVGMAGTVLRWNGTAWSPVAGAANIDYTGVWGTGPNDVWLIGTSTVQRWTGSTWAQPVSIPGKLNSIHGTGPTDVWVAVEPGYLRHYTGTWNVVMPGGGTTQYTVEAIAANNVWSTAPGSGSRNWNGSAWTPHASDPFVEIHAFAANDIWGVTAGKAGHWNGTSWTSTVPFGANQARSVSGAGGHLWVVGSGAMILHRN